MIRRWLIRWRAYRCARARHRWRVDQFVTPVRAGSRLARIVNLHRCRDCGVTFQTLETRYD